MCADIFFLRTIVVSKSNDNLLAARSAMWPDLSLNPDASPAALARPPLGAGLLCSLACTPPDRLACVLDVAT